MKKPLIIIVVIIMVILGLRALSQSISARNGPEVGPEQASAVAVTDRIESRVSASGVVESKKREILKAQGTDTIARIIKKENSIGPKGAHLIIFKNRKKPLAAPYDSVLVKLFVEEGDTIHKGQPLVEIFDNKNFQTRIMVDELDLPSITAGQEASIVVKAFPDKVFPGKVTEIGQEGRTANGVSSFPVTITFEETEDIRVGMTTEATIVTAVKEDALVVPIEAVSIVDGEKTLIVENPNGTTETRVVETGIYSNVMVEITEGLEEGELVRLPQATNNLYQQFIPEGFPVQGKTPDSLEDREKGSKEDEEEHL